MNFNGIEFPVRINQIKKFMQQNKNIAVNVYFFDSKEKRICPLFLALETIEKKHYIHLLLITEPNEQYSTPQEYAESTNVHYCWIKNLSSLVRAQLTKNCLKISFCDRCLNHFS